MGDESKNQSTAEVFGSPGEGARVSGLFRILWPFLLVLPAVGYLLGMAVPVPGWSLRMTGFGLLLAAGVLGWAVPWSEKKFAQYAKGAQGEEAVARLLGFLPAGYVVFHSVPMPGRGEWAGRNFDHVVAGPTGLFVVETKNWSGRITVEADGVRYDGIEPDRPPLRQVTEAADILEKALHREMHIEVPVIPVLCFAGNPLADGSQQVGPVTVCDSLTLRDVLLNNFGRSSSEYACGEVVKYLKKQYG